MDKTIIAIVGPTGGGKSSLVNQLIGGNQTTPIGVGGITKAVTYWPYPRADGAANRVLCDTPGSDYFLSDDELDNVIRASKLVILTWSGHTSSLRKPLYSAQRLNKPFVFVRTCMDRYGAERIRDIREADQAYISNMLNVANPIIFYVSTLYSVSSHERREFDWGALCENIDNF